MQYPCQPAVGRCGHASGNPDTDHTGTSHTTRKPCAAALPEHAGASCARRCPASGLAPPRPPRCTRATPCPGWRHRQPQAIRAVARSAAPTRRPPPVGTTGASPRRGNSAPTRAPVAGMGKSEQVAEHCAGIGERLSVSGNRFKALPGGFRAPEGNSKKRGASGALVPPFPGGHVAHLVAIGRAHQGLPRRCLVRARQPGTPGQRSRPFPGVGAFLA
jgi:hypothetical protein